jgi:hypothetical protein
MFKMGQMWERSRLCRATSAGGLAAAVLAGFLWLPMSAYGMSALSWSAPRPVDQAMPFGHQRGWSFGSSNLSCVSATWCVGVDDGGQLEWSTSPAGGGSAWRAAAVDPRSEISGVSCPSVSLCVAVDPAGDVVSSTDPLGGAGAWKVASVDSARQFFGAVACPSTTFCVAVDDYGYAVTSTDPAGGASAWSAPVLIGPTGSGAGALACPSVSLCVAVGVNDNLLISSDPAGTGMWTSVQLSQQYSMRFISCPMTTLCVGVDTAGHVWTSTDPTGGASAWTMGQLDDSGPNQINGVSCPSAGLCLAIDSAGNVLSTTDPADGAATWSTPVKIDSSGSLYAISCPSAGFCAAGDGDGEIATSTNPSGATAAWRLTDALQGANSVGPISCASASLCVALDDAGRLISSTSPGSPHPVWNVPTTASLPDSSNFELSCPSVSLCVAFASHNQPSSCSPCAFAFDTALTSSDPAAGPAAWSSSTPSAIDEGSPPISALSCASNRLCAATSGGVVFTSTQPTNGDDWTATGAGQNQLSDISCNSRFLCVATDYQGDVSISTEPTGGVAAWKTVHIDRAAPLNPGLDGPQAALYGVSCASGLLCAIVDGGGNVLTSTDPTGTARAWTTHDLNLGYALTQIACPSIALCVGIGPDGNVVTSTDPTGPVSSWKATTIDPGVTLTSLSCPSARLCLVGDDDGDVIAGTGAGPSGVGRRVALAALGGALRHSCTRQDIDTIYHRGRCLTPFIAGGPGQVTMTWRGQRDQTLATGQVITTSRARVTVDVVLTATGKRLLHGTRRIRIRINATFLDAAGHLYSKSVSATLIRGRPRLTRRTESNRHPTSDQDRSAHMSIILLRAQVRPRAE